MYESILKVNLFSLVQQFKFKKSWIFQHNYNPKYTAKLTWEWFVQNNVD